MSEGAAQPFDVALDELMPGPMSHCGPIVSTRPEMHHVLDAGILRCVQKDLALPQHVHGVSCQEKDPIDSLKGGAESFDLIEVQRDGGHTQIPCLRRRTRGGNHLNRRLLFKSQHRRAAHLTSGASDENPGCR